MFPIPSNFSFGCFAIEAVIGLRQATHIAIICQEQGEILARVTLWVDFANKSLES